MSETRLVSVGTRVHAEGPRFSVLMCPPSEFKQELEATPPSFQVAFVLSGSVSLVPSFQSCVSPVTKPVFFPTPNQDTTGPY